MSPEELHIPFSDGASAGDQNADGNTQTAQAEQPAQQPVEPSASPQQPQGGGISMDQLINLAIEKEASDIHFGEGRRAGFRISGKFTFIENMQPLSADQAEQMVAAILPEPDSRKLLERKRELDFSYTNKTGVNFRVNAFFQRGRLSVVMRMAPKHVPTIDELGTPPQLQKFLSLKEGLILVTGVAGSGKTTTVNALLNHINENMVNHILTIENPIEHIFEDKRSVFSQRELGKDTLNFATALRSAEHEDANVVFVSEVADMETVDAILTAVETGHLVIANINTRNARQTVDRIYSMYPPEQREQIRDRLAEDLIAIMAQDLVHRSDKPGQVAVYELLINTPAVRRVLRSGSVNQIDNAIHSGGEDGMITLADYANHLYEQGIISEESYQELADQE